mmetsp:Transcript_91340/g.255118  ORF Transcript_91340/g.255118 Transcript_91340/m.255118 type:complete len:529 (+) Transcript_91340:250-1836(+)
MRLDLAQHGMPHRGRELGGGEQVLAELARRVQLVHPLCLLSRGRPSNLRLPQDVFQGRLQRLGLDGHLRGPRRDADRDDLAGEPGVAGGARPDRKADEDDAGVAHDDDVPGAELHDAGHALRIENDHLGRRVDRVAALLLECLRCAAHQSGGAGVGARGLLGECPVLLLREGVLVRADGHAHIVPAARRRRRLEPAQHPADGRAPRDLGVLHPRDGLHDLGCAEPLPRGHRGAGHRSPGHLRPGGAGEEGPRLLGGESPVVPDLPGVGPGRERLPLLRGVQVRLPHQPGVRRPTEGHGHRRARLGGRLQHVGHGRLRGGGVQRVRAAAAHDEEPRGAHAARLHQVLRHGDPRADELDRSPPHVGGAASHQRAPGRRRFALVGRLDGYELDRDVQAADAQGGHPCAIRAHALCAQQHPRGRRVDSILARVGGRVAEARRHPPGDVGALPGPARAPGARPPAHGRALARAPDEAAQVREHRGLVRGLCAWRHFAHCRRVRGGSRRCRVGPAQPAGGAGCASGQLHGRGRH